MLMSINASIDIIIKLLFDKKKNVSLKNKVLPMFNHFLLYCLLKGSEKFKY